MKINGKTSSRWTGKSKVINMHPQGTVIREETTPQEQRTQ
jgi:hypothetical protein